MLEAQRREGVVLPLDVAIGHVSGGMVWAYPPGVPLLVPGEEVTADLCQTLQQMEMGGIILHGEHCDPPRTVWTVKTGGV